MFFHFEENVTIATKKATSDTAPDFFLPDSSNDSDVIVTLRDRAERSYHKRKLNMKMFGSMRFFFGRSFPKIGRYLIEHGHEVVCIESYFGEVLWTNPQSYFPLAARA